MQATQSNPADALVVQLTDTHLSATPGSRLCGIEPARTLEAVIELAAPQLGAADHIVLSGDLTHDGSVAGARHLRSLLASFGRPFSYLPGNHDDPAALAEAFGGRADDWPRRVPVQGWDLILLNSRVPGREGGRLGDAQRERLAALLRAAGTRPVLVAVHHHPVPVGSPWMDVMALSDREPFLALLHRHPRVRAVLFGHVHQGFDVRVDGLRVLGSPSTCMQFEPNSRTARIDRRLPGFRWLKLHPNGEITTGVERLTRWPDDLAPLS